MDGKSNRFFLFFTAKLAGGHAVRFLERPVEGPYAVESAHECNIRNGQVFILKQVLGPVHSHIVQKLMQCGAYVHLELLLDIPNRRTNRTGDFFQGDLFRKHIFNQIFQNAVDECPGLLYILANGGTADIFGNQAIEAAFLRKDIRFISVGYLFKKCLKVRDHNWEGLNTIAENTWRLYFFTYS